MPEINNSTQLSKRLQAPSGAAIETLSDLLADAQYLDGICETALQFALDTIGRSSGLLVAQTGHENEPACISQSDLPQEWQRQLDDPASPLRKVIRSVLENNQYISSELVSIQPGLPGLAAAAPLTARSGVQGVLLISGAICSPIEVDWLLKLSRPIGRAIRISRSSQSQQDPFSGDAEIGGPEPDLVAEIQAGRALLHTLINSLPGEIYIIDSKYDLVALNVAVANRVGRDASKLPGMPCYQALYERNEPCVECLVSDTLKRGKGAMRTSLRPRRFNASKEVETISTWEVRTFPVFDASTSVVQAILFEQDITDRRELEAVVAQSGKLAALGQLAAGVAHEINNPLTAIIANAQILQRELPPGDERLESVELIAMAGARAAQVVRNLLDFARKEQAQRILTDVNETLRASLALVQHELVSRAISLQYSPSDQLPLITAAPDSLQGVWLNLLLNAVESIDRVPGLIRVISRRVGDEVLVSISDNGRGIPADRLERIFEPFYTTKPLGRGTGLGLSVCSRIVEQHNGRISVESQVGQGTEFRVALPIT